MPQSPIDIKGAVPQPCPKLSFCYEPFTPELEHTGYTVQIDSPTPNHLKMDEAFYDLIQFHFHEPSEHYIEGKRFALEIHFVHKHRDDSSLAVVGVMVSEGAPNALLEEMSAHLPKQQGEKTKLAQAIKPLDLMPPSLEHYRLMGSLTTEPYLEGVLWLIMTQPITASKKQIDDFHQVLHNNARALQPHKNRDIFICSGGRS